MNFFNNTKKIEPVVFNDVLVEPQTDVLIQPKPKINIVEKLGDTQYNPVNIIDLNNIDQFYDNGKVKIMENFNLQIKDIKDKGQFISILGSSGCGKCFAKDSLITIRNKKTGKIEEIESFNLIKRLRQPV